MKFEEPHGSMDLIAIIDQKRIYIKDDIERGCYIKVALDQHDKDPEQIRKGQQKATSNPWLHSKKKQMGEIRYIDHYVYYSMEERYKIEEAAADKKIVYDNGKILCGVHGSLKQVTTPGYEGSFKIDVNEPLTPSSNPEFSHDVLQKQKDVIAAVRAYVNSKDKQWNLMGVAQKQQDGNYLIDWQIDQSLLSADLARKGRTWALCNPHLASQICSPDEFEALQKKAASVLLNGNRILLGVNGKIRMIDGAERFDMSAGYRKTTNKAFSRFSFANQNKVTKAANEFEESLLARRKDISMGVESNNDKDIQLGG